MAIIFEISKPFKRVPFYRRTTYSYNIGWLYFALRFVPNVHAK